MCSIFHATVVLIANEGVMAHFSTFAVGLFHFCLSQPSAPSESSQSAQVTEVSSPLDTPAHCRTFRMHAALEQLLSSELVLLLS